MGGVVQGSGLWICCENFNDYYEWPIHMKEQTETPSSYGKVYKTLHWLLVLNIGATMIFSYGMSDLTDAEKFVEYGKHAVSVTTIFILMVIRTIWRLMNPPPPLPMEDSMQKTLAHSAHIAL
jgi:cytochrome b561